jgi:hypothetical protein
MRSWLSTRARLFPLFAVLLFFWFSATVGAGTYPVSVEPGDVATVNVLDRDKAPPTAVLDVVSGASHGTATIASDKRTVSYRAQGDFIGSDTVTYHGKDPNTNQEYSGSVEVSVVAPQRIVGLDYARVAGVLGIIFVLAFVLEIGLATLFSWKYFQENLEGKGLRTPIAVAVSEFFTYFYGLDVVSDLLSAFTSKGAAFEKTLPGYVVTAFIIAGGSGTVNRLFAALGLRPPVQDTTPETAKATLVVTLTRGASLGPTAPVSLTIDNQLQSTESGNRLPAQGSYSLAPGPHTIKLDAVNTAGQALTREVPVNLAAAANVT